MATYADIEYFAELYMSLKRNILKNKFIKRPKNIDQFTQDISEVVDKIEELHTSPIDFLKFMVKYYSPMRIVPSPRHLLSDKAMAKYRYHQVLKNVYEYAEYSTNGDEFTINETYEVVSYRNDIMLPPDKDLRLKFAVHLASYPTGNLIYEPKSKRDIIYAITKLRFLNKPVPVELIKLKERILEHEIDHNYV